MFWALFLILSAVTAQESLFDSYLFKDRWLEDKKKGSMYHNFTDVSPACNADMMTWQKRMVAFVEEVELCGAQSVLCTDKMKHNMKKDMYALKQLDSFGRLPPGLLDIKLVHYGSFEECNEVSAHFYYPTQYCFLNAALGNCTDASSGLFKTAVCMPKSCTPDDITLIFNDIGKGATDHCSTVCVADKGYTNTFTWVFTAFMGALVVICVIASALEYILEHFFNKPIKSIKSPALLSILVFSYFTNAAQILDTTPPREGHLRSLDCIRFISMLWVASGHVFNMIVANPALVPLLQMNKPILNDTLLNAWYSVDTFFCLSGLLVSYMFFKMVNKNPNLVKNPFTWILYYVHRYLRLTPPYMLFVCFWMVVLPTFTGVIPTIWNADNSQAEMCRKYWWHNLLYFNNFDGENQCYGPTWYLACDTQMYIAAPIVLVALFFSNWIGIGTILAIGTGSVTACMVIMMKNHLGATPVIPDKAGHFLNDIYNMPWIRCTPYLVGLYTGYLLAKYKSLKLNRTQILVGWAIAIAMGLAIVYGPYKWLEREEHWSTFVRAFYYTFSRVGWGLVIAWVVMANHYGWAGPVSSFMCHPLWQPLGRLSYTAYLVHMFFIFYFFYLFDEPPQFTSAGQQFLTFTIPIVVITYVFAFFWSCTCELPFLKLEKMLVDGLTGSGRRKVEPVKTIETQKAEEKEENWVDESLPEEKQGVERL